MWLAHFVHFLAVSYFLGFLALDTIVIRGFLNKECRGKKITFYEKAKTSLYFAATVIIFSGLWMIGEQGFVLGVLIWIKISLAIIVFTLFFLAPHIMKKYNMIKVWLWYAVITAISLLVAGLGRYGKPF